ncbi:Endonuclease, Uma2 family (restriction endonuclease fold) [Cyclobacterium xiamenense]|uniref:Endonuclease, Uma2 family (Restriction endonuclease fold) n=1 Tax=Cyclobacterium xiamenense TaxID=1297121 RepID=A0A1H7A4C5_9BACT|nr:Uma2 family endonuclease [Cyclobacterium xiamenense]SEJ60559.1 Endonuclease, Uma2 family (restriction endonuclease fold) [Cyclobacterium xiamenense]
MNAKKDDTVNEPDLEYSNHSYADYLTWQMDEVVELIKGKIFKKAAAAPRRIHQRISAKLLTRLYVFLENKACQVYSAPFDVRFPTSSKEDKSIYDVVQPDICVICDLEKLDDRGCIGVPDLIVEILSPGNSTVELKHKFTLYESNGVREYWIIHPETQDLLIYSLVDGKYVPSKLFTSGDVVESKVIKGFKLDLEEFFRDME